jgi:hypothetical protein
MDPAELIRRHRAGEQLTGDELYQACPFKVGVNLIGDGEPGSFVNATVAIVDTFDDAARAAVTECLRLGDSFLLIANEQSVLDDALQRIAAGLNERKPP